MPLTLNSCKLINEMITYEKEVRNHLTYDRGKRCCP